MPSFEDLCAQAEAIASEIEKLAAQLQRSAIAMKKAAREGNPTKIRQGATQVDEAAVQTQQIQNTAARAWPLSDAELTELLKGPYVEQLIQAAGVAGVSLSRLDNCLAAFPVILQVQAEARAVKLDNVRLTSLRPAIIIERVRAAQKKARSQPEKFIEVLHKAYRLVVGPESDQGTTLIAVYEALTLLPDARKTYGKPEFARDVYELDSSGLKQTSSGMQLTLPAATGTRSKGDTLSIVSPDGMPKYYYGIRFERPA